jgi:hypothetical protein
MTDLVGLLYRADWTRLSLAAEVSTSRDLDLDRTRYGARAALPRAGREPRQRVRRRPELVRGPGRR